MGIIEDTGLVGQQYSELYSSFRHNKIFFARADAPVVSQAG
jgi:hypothetical protein